MTSNTVSAQLRLTQDRLNIINDDLAITLSLAQALGLAPFHIAGIHHAIDDTRAAWDELNAVAASLELTGAHHKL